MIKSFLQLTMASKLFTQYFDVNIIPFDDDDDDELADLYSAVM